MLLTAVGVSAQTAEENQQNVKLTPEIIQRISQRLRIKPDGRHMQAVIAAQYGGVAALDKRIEEQDEDEAVPDPIILHLRSTKGIPIPRPEELPPVLELSEEQQQQIIEEYLKGVEEIKELHSKVPELPKCTESKTTREDTGMKDAHSDKTILFDMLFMRKDQIPLDPDEVFGAGTIVQPYVSGQPDGPSFATIGVGVTCLPTRMRATKAYVYRDEGANALKNFDENPHGKGKVHPKMKELVNSF